MTKTKKHFALGQKRKVSIYVLVSLLLLAGRGYAQKLNETGTPFIRNYTPEEYGAHSQNWNAIQDQRGIMYFANTNGILEFDGRNWNLIKIPSSAGIRSLGRDDRGTIYAGAIGDFGFLASDAHGKTVYVSLLDKLNPKDRDFNDVWKTIANEILPY